MVKGKDSSAWILPLVFAINGILSGLLFVGPFRWVETYLLDIHLRWRHFRFEDPSIFIVAVDTTSLEKFGNLPWSVETTTQLFDALALSGAAAIGSTVAFSDESAQALSPSTRAFLKRTLVLADTVVRDPYDPRQAEYVPASKAWRNIAAGTGIADIETLLDGVCRLQPLLYDTASGRFPSFELRLVQISEGLGLDNWSPASSKVLIGTRRVPTDRKHRLYINYVGRARTFPFIPAYKILNGEISPGILRGKIVLIGAASPRLARDVPAPTALSIRMPEIEVHANALHTILTRRFIYPMPAWLSVALTALVAVGMGAVFRHQGNRRSIFLLGITVATLAVAAHLLFVWFGFWFYVLSFVLSLGANYILTVLLELRHLRNAIETAIVRMATVASRSGFRGGASSVSDTEFWTGIAHSLSRFLTVDSMVFLEKSPTSSSLHIGIVYPELAKQTLLIEHHDLHSVPYSQAQKGPVICQEYVKNKESDSLVVPLLSGQSVIGFWVMNLVGGRPYFEQNEDTIRYFARQVELELIKRRIIAESKAGENSLLRRFIEFYRRHARSEELTALTNNVVEERLRLIASINSLADGLLLYDLFGRLILYNESAYQISRGIIEDWANCPLHELIYRFLEASGSVENPDETRSEIIRQIERVIRTKEGAVYLLTIDDVPKRYYQCMLTAIEDTSDPALSQVIGVACVLNDISMFSNIPDYSNLLETISERGRNLMTPILGLVPLLGSSEDLSASQRYALEVIRRNAEELSALFDEFRNAPSMNPVPDEVGPELPKELENRLPIDVSEVVREMITKKGSDTRLRLPEEPPLIERVWGSLPLLRSALESLVALLEAFLPPEGVLDVSLAWSDEKHIRLTFASSCPVTIPPQTEAYITEQLGLPASELGVEGTTIEKQLSLPQIRHIIEILHHGTLERVSSLEGKLVFTISLPTVIMR